MKLFLDLLFSFFGFVVVFYSIFGVIVWLFWPQSIALLVLGVSFIGVMIFVARGIYEAKKAHMHNKGRDQKLYNPNPDI